MDTQLSENENAIKNILTKSNIWEKISDGEDTNTNWTKALNKLLYELAKTKDRKYQVACKNEPRDNTEWLYDLVWYTENDFGINDVHLIVESEWEKPKRFQNEKYDYFIQIKYDFEKLMLARCSTKLMIFESDDQKEIDDKIGRLTEIIINSKLTQNGDRYLFCVWNKETQQFFSKPYIHNLI